MPTTYAIIKGNEYMDATLYTGSNTTNTIVNAGVFQPDFVWVKGRSAATSNILQDSVRGAGKSLVSNSTGAETGTTGDLISSFNSNGFTVNINLNGGTDPSTDLNGTTYVGWQWAANQGANVTNTTGTITTTVSANTTAGFSIIKYTGNNTAGATIGHGLGVAPQLVIARRYNAALDWVTWHTSIPASQYLYLNTTAAAATDNTYWNSTAPTSSVITLGSDTGVNGSAYNNICYAWAPVPGFSQFGSYTGNGSADGPFIYTGFRPKFVMIKRTDGTPLDSWYILDTARSPYNVANTWLTANSSDAEATGVNFFDFLSNGFKIRASGGYENTSGANYIYAAWAETPFKYANAR